MKNSVVLTKEEFREMMTEERNKEKRLENLQKNAKIVPKDVTENKIEEPKKVKVVRTVDKDLAKVEKAEIGKRIANVLGDYTIKVQSNGEILVRANGADFSIKITQKKDRIDDLN